MPSSAINITANAASRWVRVFNQVAQQCAVPILFLIFISPLYQWSQSGLNLCAPAILNCSHAGLIPANAASEAGRSF